ncbi:MAG: mycofactocin biosynthesis peptidyl-dipeptidase MftE [Actinomycetota bacterium]|nr:mycofactocin biosynthesis peptidyl-dipeptidase MftE [Actinomycetota bacterium]
MRWPELIERSTSTVLAVPLGSTEQHGPHLPLATDTDIAEALAARLAVARPAVLVAPALPYGSSGEHAGFAGTLSIGQAALEHVVVELVRSADDFAGVVLVCAHGGNAEPLARAEARLRSEGRWVLAWMPSSEGADAHAGRSETSMMLALDPAMVDATSAVAGNQQPIGALLPALRIGGVRAVSANGVLGDPSGASATGGESLLAELSADLVAAFDRRFGPVLPDLGHPGTDPVSERPRSRH